MEGIMITPNEEDGNIILTGCFTREKAHSAAEEWCDENNSILVEIQESEDSFIGVITSDDY